MTSEAKALPPPEFILNTIPLTFLSFLAFLIALTVVADPILFSSPFPELIAPVAYMIAILFLLIFFFLLLVTFEYLFKLIVLSFSSSLISSRIFSTWSW